MARNILVTLELDQSKFVKGALDGTAAAEDLEKAIKGLNDEAKKNEPLRDLGRAMQDATESTHQLRSGVDDVVEQLNLFGDAGASLVAEINKIPDPMQRIAAAQELMARKAELVNNKYTQLNNTFINGKNALAVQYGGIENLNSHLGDLAQSIDSIRDPQLRLQTLQQSAASMNGKVATTLNGLRDSFTAAHTRAAAFVGGAENLAVILGGVGIAAGAVAFVVGGALKLAFERASEGLKLYIEKNKEAKRFQDFLAKGTEDASIELGKSVNKVSQDYQATANEAERFTDRWLGGFSRLAQGQSTWAAEFKHLYGVEVPGAIAPAGNAVVDFGNGLLDLAIHHRKVFGVLDATAARTRAAQGGFNRLTDTVKGQTAAVTALGGAYRYLGSQLDEAARKAQAATPYLDQLTAKDLTAQSAALGLPEKTGPSLKERRISARDAASARIFGGQPSSALSYSTDIAGREGQATSAAARFTQGADSLVTGLANIGGASSQAASPISTYEAAVNGAEASTKKWEETIQGMSGTMVGFAGSFVSASAQIAVAMAGQGGAWRAWQQAGLQAIAGVADYYANLLIGIGTGELFINPGLSAAAFAGALILKGLSGALAGASDKIGSKGEKSGGKSSTRSTTRDALPAQRPAEPREQTIVLEIDGNRVGEALISPLQRLGRAGRLLIPASTR